MGGGIKNGNDEPIRIVTVDNTGETGETGCTTGSSTTDTTTSSGGSGRGGRGGSGGKSTDTTTNGEQKEIVSELAILTEKEKEQYQNADEKEQKRILRNAKRRERYAKQKAEPKPKKVNKKSKTDEIDRTQINAIISGLSTAIASRPNCSHWQMSNDEIDTITKPLCNMLKESEIFEKTLEHSNEIALVTACATVFLPRIIATVMIEKEKNKNVKNVKRKTTENQRPVSHDDSRNATDTKNSSVNDLWLGSALY